MNEFFISSVGINGMADIMAAIADRGIIGTNKKAALKAA